MMMQNSFQLFDLPVDFNLDLNELNVRYLRLQKALHPDNFAHKSEQEQRIALQQSARINDAYQCLKDPILRAESIVEIATSEVLNKENTRQDLKFLMQQMALREQLGDIETSKDLTALDELQSQVAQLNRTELASLNLELAQQQWQQAKLHIDRLKFLKKLGSEIERIEEVLAGF